MAIRKALLSNLWIVYLVLMTLFALALILYMSEWEFDLSEGCVTLGNPIYASIFRFTGSVIELLGLVEWRVSHRLIDVDWYRPYWCAFFVTSTLCLIVLIIWERVNVMPLIFINIFVVESTSLNRNPFRRTCLVVTIVALSISYLVSIGTGNDCRVNNVWERACFSIASALCCYGLLKQVEYAIIKIRFPQVNVVMDLNTIVREALSRHVNPRGSVAMVGKEKKTAVTDELGNVRARSHLHRDDCKSRDTELADSQTIGL
mmetsp:Transcript_14430/g.21938  ORF Transcript_14430/g.21938 Transcript_14430/m.21938 type:complete len:260 (+) Transcript_14430:249-1028(+)